MTPRIHHIGIGVVDLDGAERYWGDVVGARRVSGWRQAGEGKSRLLATANVHLELLQVAGDQPPPAPPTDPGLGHLCVQSWIGIDGVGKLERAGTTFPRPPVQLATTITYAYADDPEGNVVELEQWPEARTVPPTWPAHVGIATADITRTHTFWAAVFDCDPVASMRWKDVPGLDQIIGHDGVDLHWRMFDLGSFKLELAQYVSPTPTSDIPSSLGRRGYNHVALQVDDVWRERDRLADLGAEFSDDIVRHADGGASVHGRDVDGNVLELLDPVAAVHTWEDLAQVMPESDR